MLSAGPNLNDLISCIECSTVLKSHMPQIVYCLSTQKNRQRPFVHQPSFIQSILPFVCFFHPSFYRSNHHPFVCLSVHPSTHPSVCPPIHPFVYPSFRPAIRLFYPSFLSSIHPSVHHLSVVIVWMKCLTSVLASQNVNCCLFISSASVAFI